MKLVDISGDVQTPHRATASDRRDITLNGHFEYLGVQMSCPWRPQARTVKPRQPWALLESRSLMHK
jgi:hypothetical protein